MNPLVFQSAARFITPILLLYAVFAFVRGHNEPGGGFIGGLVAGTALSVVVLVKGAAGGRRMLRFDPRTVLAGGLVLSLIAGIIGPLLGKSFLTGAWFSVPTPLGVLKLGTPLLFDLGVFLIVVGMVLTVILVLAEEPTE